jgi:branched-chain amino acid transport system substrate-binding protein
MQQVTATEESNIMRTKQWMTVASVAVVVALAASACGSSRNDTSSGGGSGTTLPGTSGFSVATDNCQSYNPTEGITDSSITIASSFPQSGLYAAYAKISTGYQAYVKYANANGGVDGKQIKLVLKDDVYAPDKTKTNVEQAIQQDKAFALFNIVGTANNMAVAADQNDLCVPNLFAATGSPLMGQPAKYPWLIGSIPTYATESANFATYLKANKPNAKVGFLRQADDFGDGYYTAFKKAIEGTGITIVSDQKYNPGEADLSSQMTTLAASGADTAFFATTGLECVSAMNSLKSSGWKPTAYISATCTSSTIIGLAQGGAANGVISSIYLKDPSDPEWANDAGMKEFQTLGAQNGLSAEALSDGIVGYGWSMGQLLVDTLKGGDLTRQAVMTRAYNLKNVQLPLLLPGISVNTNGTTDPYPIEQMQIGIYGVKGPYWDLQGQVESFEGTSGQYSN